MNYDSLLKIRFHCRSTDYCSAKISLADPKELGNKKPDMLINTNLYYSKDDKEVHFVLYTDTVDPSLLLAWKFKVILEFCAHTNTECPKHVLDYFIDMVVG